MRMRCGVVTTSCVSCGLEVLAWWARYHRERLGMRIFLYVHDATSPLDDGQSTTTSGVSVASSLLQDVKEALEGLAEVMPSLVALKESPVDVVAMQERNVADAITKAREEGCDWLFHFDDDELLYKSTRLSIEELMDKLSPEITNARLDNIEVQKMTRVGDSNYNYFRQEKAFKLRVGLHADGEKVHRYHDPRFFVHGGNPATGGDGLTAPFLSYWNGKSAGRLSEPGLKPCGVHFFASKRHQQHRIQGLVILHFPFCHYQTWRHKFNVLDASQRSDWGHYREARLAIVQALGEQGGGEQSITQFYQTSILGLHQQSSFVDDALEYEEGNEGEDEQEELVAVYFPPEAAPQEWRSGIYSKKKGERHYAKENSFLYRVAEQAMWLVGSTVGSTSGAAVVYDAAEKPWHISGVWTVYDGEEWVETPDAAIGRVLRAKESGQLFSVVDLDDAAPNRTTRKICDEKTFATRTKRGGPDHALLASIVVTAIDSHTPYREKFWEAVTKAAGREPPGDVADMALQRAIAAGAKAMGAPPVAASLVAERLASSHGPRAREALARSRQLRQSLLEKHADQDIVHLTIANGVQSWRAGMYASSSSSSASTSPESTTGNKKRLYRRVKERADEQDSFLFPLQKKGMWLVGSKPGSTTGGLVAYDRATRPHDIKAPWHVYDGNTWIPAGEADVCLQPVGVSPHRKKKPPPKRGAVAPLSHDD